VAIWETLNSGDMGKFGIESSILAINVICKVSLNRIVALKKALNSAYKHEVKCIIMRVSRKTSREVFYMVSVILLYIFLSIFVNVPTERSCFKTVSFNLAINIFFI
jgi:hypothetical protein